MKKVVFIILCTLTSFGFFSCSEDEDPNWVIHKIIINRKSTSGDNSILKNWNDTIYNKPEEYVMAEVALFQSKSDNNYRYVAEYRKF